MNLDFSKLPDFDLQEIEKIVGRYKILSLSKEDRLQKLKLALSMIDLTTLEGSDTTDKIKQLCHRAMHLADDISGVGHVAAVCVYPNFIETAKRELEDISVNVAAVAGGFPSGQTSTSIKIAETKYAIDQGADEIDMVINRGKFLEEEYNFVYDEIAGLKEVCGTKHLKVILETGELDNLRNVRIASEIAIAAGADFIKTSTGKVQPAATLEVTYVMLQAINDHYKNTGKMIGMKPAGGISTAEMALQYLAMLNDVLGPKWMTKEYFRFGASRLAQAIVTEIIT